MGATASAAAAAFGNRNSPAASEHERLVSMDPNKLVADVEQLGVDWAAADEEANLMEETKKTMLAHLTMLAQQSATGGKPMAMNLAETKAMADPQYREHLELMVKKRAEANRLKVKYDTGRVKIDLLRSLLANERASMQFSGSRT